MQHQRGNHATGYTSNEMFVLKVAQHGQNTSGPRCTTTRLYCRHFTRVKLLVVRYRSVSGKSSCILYNASNIRLHSAAYLLIRGRQCRCVCGNVRHSRNRFFGLIRSSVSLSPFNWSRNTKEHESSRTKRRLMPDSATTRVECSAHHLPLLSTPSPQHVPSFWLRGNRNSCRGKFNSNYKRAPFFTTTWKRLSVIFLRLLNYFVPEESKLKHYSFHLYVSWKIIQILKNVCMYIYLKYFYEKLRIGHFIHCSDNSSINNIIYRTVKMLKMGHLENIWKYFLYLINVNLLKDNKF